YATDYGVLEVKKFVGLRVEKGESEVKVRWKGFTQDDESWEPLEVMNEDLPKMLWKFLDSKSFKSPLKEKAKDYVNLINATKGNQQQVVGALFSVNMEIADETRGWKEIEKQIL